MSESKSENNGSMVSNGNGEKQRPDGGGDEYDAWAISSPSAAQPAVAKMPVDRNNAYYNMNHKTRGLALIFNHEHFDIPNTDSRTGTNVDCDSLHGVLQALGFRVTVHHNLKSEEINRHIQNLAGVDHTDNDCVLVTVMSHGDRGILYAKDTYYITDNLWYYFTADKCPTLAGKPKLFFIQACRGDMLDEGITLKNLTETDSMCSSTYTIPNHADFLIVFSTAPGYRSWRNRSCGSWFIQALCEELQYAPADRDILTLLTFVCQKVALDYESNTPGMPTMHQQKQVPCITSMLTRLLVFGNNMRSQGATNIITNTNSVEPAITSLVAPLEMSSQEDGPHRISPRWFTPMLVRILPFIPMPACFTCGSRLVESALHGIDNIQNPPNK